MSKIIGELVVGLVRFTVSILMSVILSEAFQKMGIWLDAKILGRRTKFLIAGLIGIAAYFLFPILTGLVMGLF